MSKQILDLDSSTIISTGTVERHGKVSRITNEVSEEVVRHGIILEDGTYTLDGKTPDWSDFETLSSNNEFLVYQLVLTTGTSPIIIFKLQNNKSNFSSICGNRNHYATVVINKDGKQYGICEALVNDLGDFSLIKQYIFFPQTHKNYEPPRDKCLGRSLKVILDRRASY